jgi:glutamine---fructose-6-phosphate transaminase (isomerizing)
MHPAKPPEKQGAEELDGAKSIIAIPRGGANDSAAAWGLMFLSTKPPRPVSFYNRPAAVQEEMMFYTKLSLLIKRWLFFVTHCRVFFGIRPESVGGPAIIFSPILPGRLNCGFAGLLSFQPAPENPGDPADQTLRKLWEKANKNGLEQVFGGKTDPGGYLNGPETIQSLADCVNRLKREDVQECLFFQKDRTADLTRVAGGMKAFLAAEEKILEDRAAGLSSAGLETVNRRLLSLKDICWMLESDILANLQKVLSLSGAEKYSSLQPAAFRKYRKLNLLLNALDRLEVRGRDSAGIQLAFFLKDAKVLEELDRRIEENGWGEDYRRRTQKGDLINRSIFISGGAQNPGGGIHIAFTYKTFSVVGELGRNVADLRQWISRDAILQWFAARASADESAIAHTRWASVGSITEENCHPVNNATLRPELSDFPAYPGREAHISVVLNGDIDNYPALRRDLEQDGEQIAPDVSTDTKIIPLQIEKYLRKGQNLTDAFRLAVNDFEGSHAIAMQSNLEPGKIFLALQGNGQSIYVGVGEDAYMISSELYGLVEIAPRFIRMNGEEAGGQLFILDQNRGTGAKGIAACCYDGAPIHLEERNLQTAEITTRDIDRGCFPHFFLKEISESVRSVQGTLRGKYRITGAASAPSGILFNLGEDMVPASIRNGLQSGLTRNIFVIGHGTAAVAGQAVADALAHCLGMSRLNIQSRVASEMSGFGLRDDLSDTLVIPITQSGTTTDTNRAVSMARARGAQILSIVNRRQSDITASSHGVFYTSDGRDIEMSVASTKAFYAQLVAGQLLALYFAKLLGTMSDEAIVRRIRHLENIPQAMQRLFDRRDEIAACVTQGAGKRYWAVVGSGPNKAAADEIRIKLSEMCYKTISSDIVENKKHIDLSAEPLILVCAAGNPDVVLDDIAKDIAIFRAHKAATVVFADEGDLRFHPAADAVIAVPKTPAPLSVILNTMAGHLWGYYAACAIDGEAQLFRAFRGRLALGRLQKKKTKLSVLDVFDLMADPSFRRIINDFCSRFQSRLQGGALSALGGKTIADLTLLLKYASGKLPLQDIRQDFPGHEDLVQPFDLLDETLGAAIDELTRPIDAIRHQAKTVTVGTSRKEKEPQGVVFDLLGALNFSVKNLTWRNIRTIHRLQPSVGAVEGYTLYRVRGLDEKGNPGPASTIAVCAKGGAALRMSSRAEQPTTLMGVKKTIVSTGHAYLGRGKIDSASIMVIPLQETDGRIGNLLLIHIAFNERLSGPEKIEVLGHRYDDIRNLINEYNLAWNDRYMEALPLECLFGESVEEIARRIQARCNPSPVKNTAFT